MSTFCTPVDFYYSKTWQNETPISSSIQQKTFKQASEMIDAIEYFQWKIYVKISMRSQCSR